MYLSKLENLGYVVSDKQVIAPKGCMLEITSMCNLRCIHCLKSSGGSYKKEISDSEYINIVKKAINYGLKNFIISGGEPFIRKKLLLKILDTLESFSNIKINITSNLLFLDNEIIDKINISKNQISIQVSLDGASSISHDRIRGLEGAWSKTIEMCELLKKNNISFSISHVINIYNKYDYTEIFKICKNLSVSNLTIGMALCVGRAKENKITLSCTEKNTLIKEIKKLEQHYSNFFKTNIAVSTTVQLLKSYLASSEDYLIIDSYGNTRLHCEIPYILDMYQECITGNMLIEDIDTIWQKQLDKQKGDFILKNIYDYITLENTIN